MDYLDPFDIEGAYDGHGPNALHRVIQRIQENAQSSCVRSEKRLKNSVEQTNAPGIARGTRVERRYWHKLFQEFAQHTLQIDQRQNTTPVGDDIVDFLAQLPGYLTSEYDDHTIAWTVIRYAGLHLRHVLEFDHEFFSLPKGDELRIDGVIRKLHYVGEIRIGPIGEALWLSCQMVKRMVTAVFTDAIRNGTKSWDATLAGCLGLVSQAVLASRAKDYNISAYYTGVENLRWQDILLTAQGSSVQNLKLTILATLHYQKRHEDDQDSAIDIELEHTMEAYNTIDVTNLLVAQGERLDVTKPAPSSQQARFLRHAAELMGMSEAVAKSTVVRIMNAFDYKDAPSMFSPTSATVARMSSDYVSMLASSQSVDQVSILASPVSAFMGHLSIINVVSTANPTLQRDAEDGNSRHAATKLLLNCRIEGCKRSFDSLLSRDQHEVSCNGTSFGDMDDEASLPIEKDRQQEILQRRKRKRATTCD